MQNFDGPLKNPTSYSVEVGFWVGFSEVIFKIGICRKFWPKLGMPRQIMRGRIEIKMGFSFSKEFCSTEKSVVK